MIYDVVVIGGGQAGLAMGYYLRKTSLSFVILDNNKSVGDAWRKRYDSLVLFTPRSYSSLPGLDLKGDPSGFPTKNEIADYLQQYAQTFDLPMQLKCEVIKVRKENDEYHIVTNDSIIRSKKVIIATGPFHTPRIPSFAKDLPKDIVQLHSSEYKNQAQLNKGSVLVVGGGNSGAQIAVELSDSYETYLSISHKIRFLPLSIGGKSFFWWCEKIGLLKASGDSFIGKKVKGQPDPIFGYELKEKIKNKKVHLKARTKSGRKNVIEFEDLSTLRVQNVIWATGFKKDYSWIDIPILFDGNGNIKHTKGVTESDGLYFLGLPWQNRRGSALLLGVGEDAEYLVKHLNL
ncbi:flavin-containing monooxygenase [Lederbergia wuyishanensis]|uniref:Flavoprotein involved in K+ transport n=1 Tax=Lederbergia wuyishanensis TaxID=1347903 RepID=A0ABU0D7Z9_9BACI|nr:NAD(P)/FAD-dependent oxidoreductase [Lederbergia wuyishanensis]MCJ8009336.1 NAD(P)/FAD-dependent oxidoreductase [Lederbergia wuyishanensis]MDQ0344529.1 putative flavoprotein involved in K+ transport [Lederbergia wuyishanensis]